MSSFLPLAVVGSGSETQRQVAENLNKLTYFCKAQDLMQDLITRCLIKNIIKND